MMALASVWIAVVSLVLAVVMAVYRPAFTDLTVLSVTYFGTPGALCLAILLLWAYRKERGDDPGVSAQRLQAKVAIGMAVLAAALVYLLVIFASPVARVEG